MTGDAVFFDLPVIGLVYYPVGAALPLAFLAFVLVGGVVYRVRRGVLTGVLVSVGSVVISTAVAAAVTLRSVGPARWSGIYALALVLLVIAITLGGLSIGRRWSNLRGLHAGALVMWLVLALAVSARAPGASYLFVWPLLFAAAAALRPSRILAWIAAAVTVLILAGLSYGVSVVMLGVFATGAIALALIVSLIVLLLAPLMALIAGDARWFGAPWVALGAVVLAAIGVFVVHDSPAHPTPASLIYAENADSGEAWLAPASGVRSDWMRNAVGPIGPTSGWMRQVTERSATFFGRRVPVVPLPGPNAVMIGDSLVSGVRSVTVRVTVPRGNTVVVMHAPRVHVLASAIDGRVVDPTRYRYRSPEWLMQYWAVPDTGTIVRLSIPAGAALDLALAARMPGLPAIPGLSIPPRPPNVVSVQDGDATIVYRRFRF